MIKNIKSVEEFKNTIKEGDYLVDFYADWCGPCKMLAPNIEEISKEINVLKVNTDEVEELAIEYGVMSIPTIIYISNGKEKSKSIGYTSIEELKSLIK